MANLLSVPEVFTRAASRYDLMNDIMSAGLHRLWKKVFVAAIPAHTKKLADIAAGSGDIAFAALENNKNLNAFCCDSNADMLAQAKERLNKKPHGIKQRCHLMQLDGAALPFLDKSIDCCTISFGIRNIQERALALSEMFRVLNSGGKFLCLEFNSQIAAPLQPIYDLYSKRLIPFVAQKIIGDSAPYTYLVESIRAFPSSDKFAQMIEEAGFCKITATPLTAGTVVLYSAYKI